MGESEKRIRAICSDYGFRFDLHAPAGSLPIVQQQQVEIVKVLFTNAELSWTNLPPCCRPRRWRGCLSRPFPGEAERHYFTTHKLRGHGDGGHHVS